MTLDPLSALSIAASVVQFVEFSSQIVSKTKFLYKSTNGILKEHAEAETVTVRLKQMTNRLSESLKRSQSGVRTLEDEELRAQYDRLMEICKECCKVSDELILHLGKLRVPTRTENRKWKSFRQALKSVWSKPAIDAMAKRLEVLREELDTQILDLLREKVGRLSIQQTDRFAKLDRNTQKIIEMLLEVDATQRRYLRGEFDALAESEKKEHAKTRAAFVFTDGEKRRVRVELALLDSLQFPEMSHRHERVADAHAKTFLWAFRDPRSYEKPWDNLVEWLSTSQGIYWIQGKAASGKSTLMRFIWQNSITQYSLKQWSGNSHLIVAAFFFWNSGVLEQLSQLGLLRSLLFEALKTQRSLIAQVLPEEWKYKSELAAHDLSIGSTNWSLEQLQRAFSRLIECASSTLKMCFFIDGLDEYKGDPEEISQYFKDLSQRSDHAKFCVSSRPWPVFEDMYQGIPGLRVQDMTHDDIKFYVEDKLENNQKMQDLLAEDAGDASELIQDLVDKAAGVFLWVVLVVKSLISGLRNGDGILHLRRRLAQLPADIESLYEHMLGSIDPLGAEEASQIFQIFRQSGHDLDLPTLERALRYSDYHAVMEMKITEAQVTHSDLAKKEASLKRMALRLNSRCKGLLEALKDDPTPASEIEVESEDVLHPYSTVVRNGSQNKRKRKRDPKSDSLSPKETGTASELLRIFYLHRTVRDYLEHPLVWESLLAKSKSTSFYPSAALLMAYITELKTTGLSRNWTESSRHQRGFDISTKVAGMKLPLSEPFPQLKAELDRIISSHWWGEEINLDGGDWNSESLMAGYDFESEFSAVYRGDHLR